MNELIKNLTELQEVVNSSQLTRLLDQIVFKLLSVYKLNGEKDGDALTITLEQRDYSFNLLDSEYSLLVTDTLENSPIFSNLCELNDWFLENYAVNEYRFVNLLINCFQHDLKVINSVATSGLIEDHDILSLLESLPNHHSNSKFEYSKIDLGDDSTGSTYLFSSNDNYLNKLYENSLLKLQHSSLLNIIDFSQDLVHFFKHQHGILYIDDTSRIEYKLNKIYVFIQKFIPIPFYHQFEGLFNSLTNAKSIGGVAMKVDYDELLSVLSNSNINIKFLQILRIYVKLLRNYDIEDDFFMVKLKNNLSHLPELSEFFLTSSSLIIKQAILLYRVEYNLCKQSFKKVYTRYMKLKMLSENSFKLHNDILIHNNFQLWSDKFKRYNSNEDFSFISDVKKQYLTVWQDKVSDHEEMTRLADSQMAKKPFNRMKLALFQGSFNSINDTYLKNLFLLIWIRKYLKVKNLNTIEASLTQKNGLQMKNIFLSNWKSNINHQLYDNYKGFVLKKYFKGKIMYNYELISRWNSFNKILLKNYFEKWKSQKKYSQLVHSFNHFSIQKKYLGEWKTKHELQVTSASFNRSISMNRFFRVWMLSSINRSSIDKLLLGRFFKTWRLNSILKQPGKDSKEYSLKYFQLIKTKAENIEVMKQEADDYYQYSLVKRKFKRMINKTDEVAILAHESRSILDQKAKQKFFNKIKGRYSQIQQMSEVLNDNKNNYRRYILRSSFSKWEDQYHNHFSVKNEVKLKQFSNFSNRNLVFKHLLIWRDRKLWNNQVLTKKEKLISVKLQGVFLKKWQERKSKVDNLLDLSKQNEISLFTKQAYFIKWLNYITYLDNLANLSNNYMNNSDLRNLENKLNYWSMKYMKTERNNQSCSIFMKRWNSLKLKGILKLWSSKMIPETNEGDEGEYDDEGYDELESPLAKFRTPLKLSPNKSLKLSESREYLQKDRLLALRNHYKRANSNPRSLNNSFNNSINLIKDKSITTRRTDKDNSRANKSFEYNEGGYREVGGQNKTFNDDTLRGNSTMNGFYTPKLSSTKVDLTHHNLDYSQISPYDSDTIKTAKKLRRITPIFIPREDEDPIIKNRMDFNEIGNEFQFKLKDFSV